MHSPAPPASALTTLKPFGGLLLACVATGVTWMLRIALDDALGGRYTFVLLALPIALSAAVGGVAAGLLATLLSALGALYFILPPKFDFAVVSSAEVWQIAIICAVGLAITAMSAAMQRARRRANQAQRTRIETQDKLLREQAEHTRRVAGIVDTAMDAVISIDGASQRIVLFNAAAQQMFGCSEAQAVGQLLDRFVPVATREPYAAAIHAFKGTGIILRGLRPLTALRADGAPFPVEASLSQLQTGSETLYTLMLRDIGESLRAEQQLRDSTERLRVVTENLHEGLVLSDLDGNLLLWNRAALRMHGVEGDTPGGHGADWPVVFADFANIFTLSTLDGRLLEVSHWPLTRLLAGESVDEVELRIRRIDSDWERIFCYSGALLDDGSDNRFAYVSLSDITARKRSEALVQQLNAELEARVNERTAQLEAKSRELESFCYSVAHDLKAPLRGIDGYSRLLLEEHGARLDEEGVLFATNVRTAAQQMTHLIDDLLTYSRQERRIVHLDAFDLGAFVERKLALWRDSLGNTTLEVDVPAIRVRADPEGLSIALRNLLDNAVKFCAGAPVPTVAVRASVADGSCVLSVSDNGIGFDMRFHDRIFEIFQRLQRSEDYPGTGIGLALVGKAMLRMGGDVWAESAPGAGATFHLRMPLALATPAALPRPLP